MVQNRKQIQNRTFLCLNNKKKQSHEVESIVLFEFNTQNTQKCIPKVDIFTFLRVEDENHGMKNL